MCNSDILGRKPRGSSQHTLSSRHDDSDERAPTPSRTAAKTIKEWCKETPRAKKGCAENSSQGPDARCRPGAGRQVTRGGLVQPVPTRPHTPSFQSVLFSNPVSRLSLNLSSPPPNLLRSPHTVFPPSTTPTLSPSPQEPPRAPSLPRLSPRATPTFTSTRTPTSQTCRSTSPKDTRTWTARMETRSTAAASGSRRSSPATAAPSGS